jgi:group I intron endonuclease
MIIKVRICINKKLYVNLIILFMNKKPKLKLKNKGEIYIIRNKINEKIYIGQAVQYRLKEGKLIKHGALGRFQQHIQNSIKGNNKCCAIERAMRKYGNNNFYIEIIETCYVDELNDKEISYIKNLNSKVPYGYNIDVGGKKSLVSLNKNRNHLVSNETREKLRIANTGKKHSVETRNKMSKTRTGLPRPVCKNKKNINLPKYITEVYNKKRYGNKCIGYLVHSKAFKVRKSFASIKLSLEDKYKLAYNYYLKHIPKNHRTGVGG